MYASASFLLNEYLAFCLVFVIYAEAVKEREFQLYLETKDI